MKKLILAALLAISGVASAEEVMKLNNNAGGSIVLTSRPCVMNGKNEPDFRAAFVTARGGLSMAACWTPVNRVLAVVYADGDTRFYHPTDFQVINVKE